MQKINLKKTTKEQMLNMLETAWQANTGANEEIAVLSKRIDEQNDALAKCVAEKNELRKQLKDADSAAELAIQKVNNELRRERGNIISVAGQRDAAIAESKDLRTKLADTEAALGRANEVVSHYKSELRAARKEATDAQWAQIDEYRRAEYAENYPWRNLWAWVKRKLRCKA